MAILLDGLLDFLVFELTIELRDYIGQEAILLPLRDVPLGSSCPELSPERL
jgi:hypothetical protein